MSTLFLSREPLETLGRYRIEGELGRGTMGVVYRGRDPELDRIVALKVIHAASALSDKDRCGYEKRFMVEARAAAALSHPALLMVHDVGRDRSTRTPYIAFEYLEGRTLAKTVAAGTAMEWRRAVRLVAAVARALHHAHSHDVIHRDIKPANIMILPTGEPKVMDFGIAKVRAAELTGMEEFFGTPLYMSPEQASGQSVDGRSDLFSLGSVLYLLLTGRHAFEAESLLAIMWRLARHHPVAPSHYVPQLPKTLDAIMRKMLAKQPAQRYADGLSLADDLERVLDGGAPHCAPPPDGQLAPLIGYGRLAETLDLRKPASGLPLPSPKPLPQARLGRWLGTPLRVRVAFAAGGVAALALVGVLPLWHNDPPARPAPLATAASAPVVPRSTMPAVQPARLTFVLNHSLRDGTVWLWADDEIVLEAPLDFGRDQVRQTHEVDIPPGERTLKLEVKSGVDTWIHRRRGRFRSGESWHISAIQSGLPGERSAGVVLLPLSAAGRLVATGESLSHHRQSAASDPAAGRAARARVE